ncbi:ribonuclease HII [Fluviicola taffensis]|uniref:Ribonuclease HII n=1 Tax=Fluviicola taffensis (strain DSM 16823 / NCIMB 13979 / RW262) TaxID=755732 RepID=F2IC86_FLUTR|nr:ribonuclease HII [Fluviicola taffensis]AEA44332.1 RNase HII [Fluviicola taffensis DSM 16823]
MQLLDHFDETKLEAGCDEAGRGCLAGPVVCASVILPKGFSHPLLNDSKQLSEKSRNLLRPIIEQEALAFSVQFLQPDEIVVLNILKASLTGMHRAAMALKIRPELLLIDGNKTLLSNEIPSIAFIKGDGKYKSIAAASILAKTYRDEYMEKLHEDFTHYDWKINKGYPTKAHRKAIEIHGACIHHRPGFNLLGKGQLSLFME